MVVNGDYKLNDILKMVSRTTKVNNIWLAVKYFVYKVLLTVACSRSF